MKKSISFIVLLLGVTAFSLSAQSPTPLPSASETSASENISKQAKEWRHKALSVHATQVVEEGEKVSSLSLMRGPVVIKGTVDGDLSVFQGDIYVLGTVRGSVNCFSGDTYILGQVNGPISIASGNIYQAGKISGPINLVNGRIVSASQHKSQLQPTTDINLVSIRFGDWKIKALDYPIKTFWTFASSTFAFAMRFSFALFWLALALLIAAAAPTLVERGQSIFTSGILRAFAIGFLWKIAYWTFGVIFLIACFIAIGMPFLAILLITQWVLMMIGLPILFLGFGRWQLRLLGHTAPVFHLGILAGGIVLSLLRLLPLIGDFAWWITTILASGLAIRYLLNLRIQSGPNMPSVAIP